MWDILSEGAMGFVILIDSARPDPLSDLDFYVNAFRKSITSCGNALVIGVTRTELNPQVDLLDSFNERLATMKLIVPVFEVDGRQREDVKQMLLALLTLLNPSTSRARSASL
jgi:signal recognition particle receptor subunit beta